MSDIAPTEAMMNTNPASMEEEVAKLREENAKLKEENAKLKEENAKLKEENVKLKEENAKLKEEIVKLREDLNELKEARIRENKEKALVDKALRVIRERYVLQKTYVHLPCGMSPVLTPCAPSLT